MRQDDPQNSARLSRLWIGAPALMLLACATTQACASGGQAFDDDGLRVGLSGLHWAIQGGGSHAIDQTRWVLARRAAFLIATLDRLRAATPTRMEISFTPTPSPANLSIDLGLQRRIKNADPGRSNRQPSAP